MKRTIWLVCVAASLGLWACDDEEDPAADTGGGTDTAQEAGEETGEDTSVDTGQDTVADTPEDTTTQTPEERGEYLVTALLACGDCHTPRGEGGVPDMDRYLAGDPVGFDINGPEAGGVVPVPNLTPDTTGLADWDDDEIVEAMLNGIDRDDAALFPIMPYWAYHNLSADDADAVVAYLRTIEAVDQEIPARDLGFPFETAAAPVPVEAIPESTLAEDDENYDAAQQGRYLAGMAGICVDCHTAEDSDGPVPVDTTAILAGGRAFPRELLGLGDPWPAIIYTRNLTPDATGIQGWTAEQVATALREGTDVNGQPLCPPMPAGPVGPFGNLTEEDALAIGHYITTIPPVDNAIAEDCEVPQ